MHDRFSVTCMQLDVFDVVFLISVCTKAEKKSCHL